MYSIVIQSVFVFMFCTVVSQNHALAADTFSSGRNLIVITDMEPDDRIALELVASNLAERVQMIGTSVKNSFRKAALVRHQLSETPLSSIPIFVGSGGDANDYTDIASSRAAREYHQEGQGILSDEKLRALKGLEVSKGSDDLVKALKRSLETALQSRNLLEIVLLAPPTDLVKVLEANPELSKAIKHIHIMGGWVEVKSPATNEMEMRSTYNINMDAEASAKLLRLIDIPMTVYSSHIIKPNFAGGSINKSNFPQIVELIESSQARGLQTFRKAGLSWDSHLIEKIPPLKNVIGENAGRQFTPADPLVIAGILRPELITSFETVNISIDLADLDSARGFRVDVKPNPNSRIKLVTGIDTNVFASVMVQSLKKINTEAVQINLKRSCRAFYNL